MFFYGRVCDFQGLSFQGKVRTLNRLGGKLNHLSMAYLFSNTCSKNYWKWTTTVKIIIGGWVVYFFGAVCVSSPKIVS